MARATQDTGEAAEARAPARRQGRGSSSKGEQAMSDGRLMFWVANWNLSRAQAERLLGGAMVTSDMVDCTHANLENVKRSNVRRFGGYITGTPDIRWTAGDIGMIEARGDLVLEIDQSDSSSPSLAVVKFAKDVEKDASQIGPAVEAAAGRIHHGEDAMIYVDQAELAAVEDACARAGLPHGEIVAYQWASPTSNPGTLLPGTDKTLSEWPADLSVILTRVMPLAPPAPPSARTDRALVHYGADTVIVTYDPAVHGWSLDSLGKNGWGIEPTTPGTGRA